MLYAVPAGPKQGSLINARKISVIRATKRGVQAEEINGAGKKRLFTIPAEDHELDETLRGTVRSVASLRSALGLKLVKLPNGDAIDPDVISEVGKTLKKDAEQGVFIRGAKDELLVFIPTKEADKDAILKRVQQAITKAEVIVE
jgi:hypothetical protein